MSLHIALLERVPAPAAGKVARRCADADASLHLIGPLDFELDDPRFIEKGPSNWDKLDWWFHRDWGDFRDAIVRDRCFYFSTEGRDISEAPLRANSVLIFGDESLALPEKIRSKYPERIFKVPAAPKGEKYLLQAGVAAVLKQAAGQIHANLEPSTAPSSRNQTHRKSQRPGASAKK